MGGTEEDWVAGKEGGESKEGKEEIKEAGNGMKKKKEKKTIIYMPFPSSSSSSSSSFRTCIQREQDEGVA